jgi:peptide/nickel transport system substrate-binding protein
MKIKITWRLIPAVILAALLVGCKPQSPLSQIFSPVVSALQPVPTQDLTILTPPVSLAPADTLSVLPPDEQDTFRIAFAEPVDNFDPLFTTTAENILPYLLETLTRLSPWGELLPMLATDWEVSDDGLVYSFALQQDVFFSDGTPFNAQAVKFNLERFTNLEPPMVSRSAIENINEIKIIDDHRLELHLNAPANDLLMALSDIHLGMLSPGSIPVNSGDYQNLGLQAPVGTGPYLLAGAPNQEQIVLHRRMDYWGFSPFMDIIQIQIVPEAGRRGAMLLNGEIDLTLELPPADLEALAAQPEMVVNRGAPFRQVFVGINTTRPNLDNPQVRQALLYAIDQQAIIDNVLAGSAQPSTSPVPEGYLGSCPASQPYSQDIAESFARLNDAGVPQDRELKLILPAGRIPLGEQVAEAVAESLRAVEFPVTVEALDWDTYLAALSAPPEENMVDLYLFSWPGNIPHANYTLQLLQTGNPLNASHYSNPQVDEWLRSARTFRDEGDAIDLYCNISQVIWEEAPWIFLYQQDDPVVYAANFANIEVLPGQRFWAIYAEPIQ